MDFVELVMKRVREELARSRDQSLAHGWDHAFRVYRMAIRIAGEVGVDRVDMEVLKLAALLHDIDEPYYDKENHVMRSVLKAERILRSVGYPDYRIEKVLNVISEHSTEDGKEPSTIESKILFDADKLDGVGAIGIARVFTFCGQKGVGIDEAVRWYLEKIRKAMDCMNTDAGRSIARERVRYVYDFIKRLEKEKTLQI